MAALPDPERVAAWAEIMRELSTARVPISITKQELRAVFDAADDWVDANAAAYNAALPQPGRSALSAAVKRRILVYTINARDKADV
jgi:hypothetical protein